MLGLGPEKEKKIFASRYKLLLPSEAELMAELLRELKIIGPAAAFRFQLFSISACQLLPQTAFSFSAWHMNHARHHNPWIGCDTSLLGDAAALMRRMPLVWCAQPPPDFGF